MNMLKLQSGLLLLLGGMIIITNCSVLEVPVEKPWLTQDDYPYYYVSEFKLIDHYKIWQKDPYSAFTDIEFFKDSYYVVFREASCCHFSDDGVVQIIKSEDTKKWNSVGRLKINGKDLRDPKLNITPSGKLTISATGRKKISGTEDDYNYRSYLWISENGKDWSEPEPIAPDGFWFWRFRWNYELNSAYGFSYKTGGDRFLNLQVSQDEKSFTVERHNVFDSEGPSESDLVFIDDSISISLVRRNHDSNAAIGISMKPFTQWYWDDMNAKMASPHLFVLPDNRIIAAVRLIDPNKRTALILINPVDRTFKEVVTLPSGGDNGYPGLLFKNDQLIVSYYSSHEGSSAIYLAKITFEDND